MWITVADLSSVTFDIVLAAILQQSTAVFCGLFQLLQQQLDGDTRCNDSANGGIFEIAILILQ